MLSAFCQKFSSRYQDIVLSVSYWEFHRVRHNTKSVSSTTVCMLSVSLGKCRRVSVFYWDFHRVHQTTYWVFCIDCHNVYQDIMLSVFCQVCHSLYQRIKLQVFCQVSHTVYPDLEMYASCQDLCVYVCQGTEVAARVPCR